MKNTDLKKLRQFGILVGSGFPLIIGWIIPTIYGHQFKLWTLWLGIILLVLGLFKPKSLFYPYKGWIKLGHILGWINSRIILGIIYITVLVPISFLMKLLNHDPLKIKKSDKLTFKEYRNRQNSKIDLKRIF